MFLSQLLSGHFEPMLFLIWAVVLVIAITIHEFSHAFVAERLGDPTAKLLGRLTLNPLAHLDPLGTFALLIIGIGWGKPVPFDPFNLKNPRRDSALISLAGPASNIVMAILISIPYQIALRTNMLTDAWLNAYAYLMLAVWLNTLLAVFNLVPIHPLDGFKVLGGILPKEWYRDWNQMERYGIFLLLILIVPFNGQSILSQIIFPIVSAVVNFLLPNLQFLLYSTV